MADDILMGVVLGAHGLKGEVKVKTFTEDPAALGAYGPVTTSDGRQLRIGAVRPTKGADVVAVFTGITDRDAAESLKGQQLFVSRAALPEPEPEEFYYADLVGLRVEDSLGAALGTVKGIHNFGAGDMLEIENTDGASDFVPFTNAAVPVVDLKGGRVVVAVQPPDRD
jgi:16S rRNA processing protein RimM